MNSPIREECTACSGDGELAITGESIVDFLLRRGTRVRSLYMAAWRALRHVHTYRAEDCVAIVPWRPDRRILGCLEQVVAYRASIKALRDQKLPALGHYAWCITCRGTGLANNECEGCGCPVDMGSRNDAALDNVDILIHRTCDTSGWPHSQAAQ